MQNILNEIEQKKKLNIHSQYSVSTYLHPTPNLLTHMYISLEYFTLLSTFNLLTFTLGPAWR